MLLSAEARAQIKAAASAVVVQSTGLRLRGAVSRRQLTPASLGRFRGAANGGRGSGCCCEPCVFQAEGRRAWQSLVQVSTQRAWERSGWGQRWRNALLGVTVVRTQASTGTEQRGFEVRVVWRSAAAQPVDRCGSGESLPAREINLALDSHSDRLAKRVARQLSPGPARAAYLKQRQAISVLLRPLQSSWASGNCGDACPGRRPSSALPSLK